MANESCKAYLKYFRKVVKAKKEERIDKRYKPYLAPNNKYYEGAHCGYCAEVQYLAEIYHKEDHQEIDKEYIRRTLGIDPELINTEFPCQSIAKIEKEMRIQKLMELLSQTFLTAEERKKFQGSYKPDPDSFNAYIDYMIGRPGQKATYEGYKKFKKEREGSK